MNTETPIAAIASALAPQAIGIVRTSGEGVIELASRYFSRPEALRAAKSHTLVHGWFLDSGPGGKREPIDEVLAAVFRGPGSFTGEDMVEIYCHGGVNVLTSVLRVLAAGGFRQAEQGEFTLRAFLNGKTDLTRAE
ncbi:MAG: tRNA uridine-5-carboxymethylaminomethyl(34) synthesis GTPase MnmE, partial [Spirochaetaceae bacterium]|nr:tRNA uridine-5-carboxymethylaminomethyl(34) synthesis GTPase MnmE [Spirochaetaceae bacterium]